MWHRSIRWTIVGVLAVGFIGGNFAIVVYYTTRPTDPGQAERTPLIDDLVAQLADGNADQRRTAAKQLCDRGPEAQTALPKLHQLLDDEDSRVRITAATAIWVIDRQAEPVLLALWNAWGKHLGNCEMQLALASDQDVADALRKVCFSPFALPGFDFAFPGVSIRSPEGGKVRAEQAVVALAKGLQHEHYGVRRMAAFLLAMNHTPAIFQVAIPELTRAVADEDSWVRLLAVQMLGEIGPPARQALPALRGLVENRMHRRAVAIGTFFSATPWNPVLLPMFADTISFEARVGEAASTSLHQIDA
jgi:HEAT repeat protein